VNPTITPDEVIAALSERGQLEWQLAAQRVLIAKYQQEDSPEPVVPADAD
jgi:hypothetical protein